MWTFKKKTPETEFKDPRMASYFARKDRMLGRWNQIKKLQDDKAFLEAHQRLIEEDPIVQDLAEYDYTSELNRRILLSNHKLLSR